MRTIAAIVAALLLAAFPTTQVAVAQMSQQDLAKMDKVVSQVKDIETMLGSRARYASSGVRNMMNFADRWNRIRPTLEGPSAPGGGESPPTNPEVSAASVPVSSPSALLKTRLAGFTQSETSTAWCNNYAVVAYNDSGSYANTVANLLTSGASFDGYATAYSSSVPVSFTFNSQGYPATAKSALMLGDPTVVCAGSANPVFDLSSILFQYSSSGSLTATGVGVSQATASGSNVNLSNPPVVAVSLPYPQHLADKPWLAIDPNNAKNLYLTFTDFDDSGACGSTRSGKRTIITPGVAIDLVSSTNGGGSWSAPRVITEVCGNVPFVQGSQVAVAPNGTVYVAWESFNSTDNGATYQVRQIDIANSSNSFANPIAVTPVNYVGDSTDLQGNFRDLEFPSMAIAPTLEGGNPNIYIAWNDGDQSMPDIVSSTKNYHFADILVANSTNGGSSWTVSGPINDGANDQTDEYQPALAIANSGRVAVCYYDRHSDSNNFLIQRSCVSNSGPGTAFGTPAPVTSTGFPSVIGQDLYVTFDYMGDYDTLTTDSTRTNTSSFLGAFGDNATGNPEVQANTE